MVDITASLILYRMRDFFSEMVERLEGFVYTDETKETVDVVNMLLFGWVVLALLVYVFGNLIANHLQKRKDSEDEETKGDAEVAGADTNAEQAKVEKAETDSSSAASSPVSIAREPVVVPHGVTPASAAVSPIPGEKLSPTSAFILRTETRAKRLPSASGTDPDCVKWVNNVVHWLYGQEKHDVNPHVDSWLNALNEQAQKAAAEHGILVEFKRLQDGSPPPQLDDILTDLESNDNLTTVCNVEAENMVFDVQASRQTGDTKEITNYEIELEKLDGKLNVACITEELLLVVRFADQPSMKLRINRTSPSSEDAKTPQERALEDVVLDIVSQSIASAVVDLNFSINTDFPRFKKSSSVETLMPIHYDSLLSSSPLPPARHERRLLVKIIKATSIGGDKGCKEAYCVVEMDDPPQKFQTSAIKDSGSPFWDEHFWFNLHDGPAELLFEIYDKGEEKDNFLGLGIVSIEELLKSPSQRQIIPLQSRPLENDDVSGSLTVEFLFMEGGIVPTKETTLTTIEPVPTGKIIETNHRVTPAGTVITTTTIQRVSTESALDTSKELASSLACHSTNACSNSTDAMNSSKLQAVSDRLETPEHCLNPLPSKEQSKINANQSDPISISSLAFAGLNGQISNLNSSATDPENSDVTMNLTQDHNDVQSSAVIKNSDNEDYDEALAPDASMSHLEISDERKVISCEESGDKQTGTDDDGTLLLEQGTSECHEVNVQDHEEAASSPFVSSASPLVAAAAGSAVSAETSSSSSAPVVDTPPALTISHSSSHVKVSTKPNQEVPGFPLTMQQKHSNLTTASNDQSAGVAVPTVANDSGIDTESITDTALKEIGKSGISSSASKSTLIIHSVQREAIRPPVKENGVEGDSTSTTPPSSPASRPDNMSPADSMSSAEEPDRARSRSKERKSLMGALKKRFSFSKSRSKSAEQRSTKEDTPSYPGSRSHSVERAKSMPASRESSAPRTPGTNLLHVPGKRKSRFQCCSKYVGLQNGCCSRTNRPDEMYDDERKGSGSRIDSNSTRSSMSELSGCSSSSARTFIHEKSTLVIEVNENDVIKHYMIPASLAQKSKWRKRGVKLHIYNGHTFVARHISGAVTCQVCKKLFPRRPGKQGYICRDCNLTTHKRCHIEVEAHCPKSTINNMEMEYIQDPKSKSLSAS